MPQAQMWQYLSDDRLLHDAGNNAHFPFTLEVYEGICFIIIMISHFYLDTGSAIYEISGCSHHR